MIERAPQRPLADRQIIPASNPLQLAISSQQTFGHVAEATPGWDKVAVPVGFRESYCLVNNHRA